MEALKNVLVKDDDFYKRKKESIDEIMCYQEVNELLVRFHLDRQFVERNWIDFLNYVEDLKQCQQCQGIEGCQKNFAGYMRVLTIEDGQVTSSFSVCPDGKKIEEERRVISLIDANVPKDIFLSSFEDLELDNDGNLAILVKRLLDDETHSPSKGLYVCGDMGIGKTFVLACFCHRLALKNQRCAFISVSQLLQDLKSYFNSSEDNGLEDLKEVDVLVLDDLGAETLSPWGRDEILFNLLNDRMLRKRPTYFTSVYTLKELEAHYKINNSKDEAIKVKRLIERIRALSDEFELKGKRFR